MDLFRTRLLKVFNMLIHIAILKEENLVCSISRRLSFCGGSFRTNVPQNMFELKAKINFT